MTMTPLIDTVLQLRHGQKTKRGFLNRFFTRMWRWPHCE